eukprot:CAMPEP_0116013314 /NCGR_PEP_ID=MMETSP0321-20121206/5657_1 /TAXON_ID=163516 /ORGANISM="Leptocylindrus danicus var. danicus, Strain B650" /LENGTH=216 /DNA_ID=CAMNT_0003482849 /DNA_START=54 /DNA_END=701 /DNA_ORIENTATION=+
MNNKIIPECANKLWKSLMETCNVLLQQNELAQCAEADDDTNEVQATKDKLLAKAIQERDDAQAHAKKVIQERDDAQAHAKKAIQERDDAQTHAHKYEEEAEGSKSEVTMLKMSNEELQSKLKHAAKLMGEIAKLSEQSIEGEEQPTLQLKKPPAEQAAAPQLLNTAAPVSNEETLPQTSESIQSSQEIRPQSRVLMDRTNTAPRLTTKTQAKRVKR